MNDFWISEYLYWGGYYHLPSGKLTVFYWKWPSWNSWFTHKKMWCSIVFCERLPECMIHWLNQFHPMVSRRIFIYFHGEVLMKKHIFLHSKTMVKPIIQACAPQADVCWFIHHSKYRYYIYIYIIYMSDISTIICGPQLWTLTKKTMIIHVFSVIYYDIPIESRYYITMIFP